MTSPSKNEPLRAAKPGRCPICESPSLAEYEPFCSKRCADVDLHRWFAEGYAIPAAEDDSDGTPADPDKT